MSRIATPLIGVALAAIAFLVYAWVGPDLTEPRLLPGARQLMEELVVAHYECLVDARLGSVGEPSEPEENEAAASA